jgi:hypothetical protein
MKQLLSLLTILTAAGIATAQIPDDAINLSADGTANCYIVTPGTTAYFDATHKGNSTTETTGDVAGCKLVWQSVESLVSRLEFDSASGSICAWTSNTPGNALVAATDSEGKILWSWHLWITEYDEANDYTTKANSAGTTWKFMDRNLGAVSTEHGSFDNFGLLYQWGRKDPFPGAATFTIMNDDYTYEQDGEPTLYDIDNNILPKVSSKVAYHGTIDLSVENPDVFYAMTYTHTGEYDEYGQEIVKNDYITGDWVDVSDDDYWGGETMEKTIYDPSPVGYKVPVCDAAGNTPYDWLKYSSMTWDSTNNGATQDGQWFPATGTRAYASGTLDYPANGNKYSGLWIGTKGKAAENLELYPDLYGQYMFIINGKRTFKVSKDKRSQGMSLRCVRDESFGRSGVKNVLADQSTTPTAAAVYNLQGMKVMDNATTTDLQTLTPGIYIYKSKKYIVR